MGVDDVAEDSRLGRRSSSHLAKVRLALCCSRLVCKEVSDMTRDPVATIRRLLSEAYGGLVMVHDAAGYAGQYAEDVLWAPPNAPDPTSKEGIQNGIQGLFDKFALKVDPQPEEIEVLGDFAYAIGSVDGVLTPGRAETRCRSSSASCGCSADKRASGRTVARSGTASRQAEGQHDPPAGPPVHPLGANAAA